MMHLQTDQQTIDDLGLFGRKNDGGIFDLYNTASTRGGQEVLKELFRNPLSDQDMINRRSAVIEHFAGLGTLFPFSAASFDIAEKYLINPTSRGNDNSLHIPTLNDKEMQNGVSAVIDILWVTKDFMAAPGLAALSAYQHEMDAIDAILSDPAFAPALSEKARGKLSFSAITAYDVLLRVQEYEKIKKLLNHIYLLDVYISVAQVAVKRNLVFAKALEKGGCELKLDGVYHVELEKPVANSLSISPDQNLVFLTGANMAGKSTFLRSVSTAMYMAHMGFPVAARSMSFSVMDGVYTTINLPDNLGLSASHFYVEVLRVKKIASELSKGKSLFVLFDELFRGTNVKDAHEATVAVSEAFASKKNSMFIISSHIVEAAEQLQQKTNARFLYLPTVMNGAVPQYTYTLKQGVTDDRHGMIIIRNEGILDILKNGTRKSANSEINFNADRQTIEELNLTGKFRSGSVYGLFNKVKTRGGEQLLNQMFLTPLNSAPTINERTAAFQFFQQAEVSFPFDAQHVNQMREYLDSGTGQNSLMVFANTILKRILSDLTRDEDYKKNIQGLQAVIVVLNNCFEFLQTIKPMAGVFADRISRIRAILSEPSIERLRKMDIYQALPVKELISYNYLLKTTLLKEIEEVLLFIYELDVNIAVSTVARAKGFTYARALPADKNVLSVTNLYHPSVEKAIGNNLFLNENSNVLFLTGANMAGKSTLMKSVGIGLYLAHIGFPVAAQNMEFSVREGLYSSINVADNIELGYSHFYAEVVRVKRAAEGAASGKRLLLMFDELFKGTNVKDAYDGTLAVTEGFADYADCLFIVSTHITEVGEALKKRENIQFSYMPTIMEGTRPRYTYHLQEGITEDRQGMMIIENEGILDTINGTIAN